MPDWHEIITRDGPAAWRTAYRIVGNSADADECFQEACLAALEFARRESLRCPRALLARLAAARAIDRLRERQRRRSREHPAESEILDGRAAAPSQHAEDEELACALRAALAKIPPLQAELFCLHGLEGWTYEAMAEQFGISTSRVGVMLHRARKKLSVLLKASLGEEAIRVREGEPPTHKESP